MEYEAVTNTSRLLGNVFAEYDIIENLAFRTSFGIDAVTTKASTFGPNFLRQAESSRGEASIADLQALTWLNENTITFNHSFNEKNRLTVLGGFTMQQFKNESLFALAFDFPDGRTGYHNLGAAQNPQNTVNSESEWSLISYLGRINYALLDKYLLQFRVE